MEQSPHAMDKTFSLAENETDRANKLNHGILNGGEDFYGKSEYISIPALIIQGTKDCVFI